MKYYSKLINNKLDTIIGCETFEESLELKNQGFYQIEYYDETLLPELESYYEYRFIPYMKDDKIMFNPIKEISKYKIETKIQDLLNKLDETDYIFTKVSEYEKVGKIHNYNLLDESNKRDIIRDEIEYLRKML